MATGMEEAKLLNSNILNFVSHPVHVEGVGKYTQLNDTADGGLIPVWVLSKTYKMILDASLLKT